MDTSLILNITGLAIAAVTSVVAVTWFYYSQRQKLSKDYYQEIGGIYAGFTTPLTKTVSNGTMYSGIVMNIRIVNGDGHFKGEFDYGEKESVGNRYQDSMMSDGIFTFMGKFDFQLYRKKTRNPFIPEENRMYSGKMFVVDRLDFDFNRYKIEDYVCLEYDIKHFRELEVLQFTLVKRYRENYPVLPDTFTLYKKGGFDFEPYRNVKETVFITNRVDK